MRTIQLDFCDLPDLTDFDLLRFCGGDTDAKGKIKRHKTGKGDDKILVEIFVVSFGFFGEIVEYKIGVNSDSDLLRNVSERWA